MFFLILNFDFRFGQEEKVKLGSPFCKYLFTINDLYNGAKSFNLPLAVEEEVFALLLTRTPKKTQTITRGVRAIPQTPNK